MCTLRKYIQENNIDHILLGNGFCKQLSSHYSWNRIVEGCDEISELQKKYDEYNLEMLLEKCETQEEKDVIIDKFISFFKRNHPNGIHTDAYQTKNYECLIETLKLKSIFTLNYDLTLYWLIIDEARNKSFFRDGFWKHNDKLRFNANCFLKYNGTCVYYLHGAVFIYHENQNEYKFKFKSTQSEGCFFIENITSQIRSDKHFPVYVFESNSDRKVTQIQNFKYLRYCYERLSKIQGNICIFGTSIGEDHAVDKHVVNQIISNKKIDKIHLGIHKEERDLKLPSYLLEHKNKIALFSTEKYTINDCLPGKKGPPNQSIPDEIFKEILKKSEL